jgi:hypothetical protein
MFIVDGINNGIDTFCTLQGGGDVVKNLPSAFQFPEKVDEFYHVEETAGRYVVLASVDGKPAPGTRPDLHFSPTGTAPKRSFEPDVIKRRVITHSSAGPSRGSKEGSVNGSILMADLAVEFTNVLDVADSVRSFGPSAKLCKTDVRSAYRNLPVRPDLVHLQCSEWRGILRADLCLGFGVASGPFTFEQFAMAIHYVLQRDLDESLGVGATAVHHYLDGCIIVCRDIVTSDRAYDIMVATYCRLGVPLSMEKTERTVTVTDFLGIVVDAEAQCLRYPADKTAEVLAELRRLQSGATPTKLQLLSLLGKLGFADIVFPLARPFVSELYRLSHSVSKDYHHVKLSGRAHGDVANWINVLTSADGLPLLDRDIDAATTAATARGDWACGDASGAGGYGFYDDTSFVAIEWDDTQRSSFTGKLYANSSTWQETASMVAAGLRWLELPGRGDMFVYFSDADNLRHNNDARRSKNAAVNGLLRLLAVRLIEARARFRVVWQSREDPMQCAADCLSRADFDGFQTVVPGPHRARRRDFLHTGIGRLMAEAGAGWL